MEEIENLINKVKENNWNESGDNRSLLKKMLNKWRFYVDIRENQKQANEIVDENNKESNEEYKKRCEEERRLIEIYDKSIEFMKGNINNLMGFVGNINEYYEIFPIIQAEKSVNLLFNKLLFEENQSIVENIRDILTTQKENENSSFLWFEPFLPGLKPFLEEISHKIVGRNSNYFGEVIENISNESIEIKNNLFKNRRKMLCGIIGQDECMEFIPLEKDEYFIAYPFSNRRIKDVIINAFKERWQRIYGNGDKLAPLTADKSTESSGVLCNICKEIHYTKFGVYVLSKQRGTNLSNPNVMLELGIAMKIGKPYILIYKKGTRNIADLAGHIRFEYNTYKELKNEIVSKRNLEHYLKMEVNGE